MPFQDARTNWATSEELTKTVISPSRSLSPVVRNSAYLILTTATGSGLGFVFWVVAARSYSVAEVGLGAAYVSAATLVAAIAELGLGTAIIRFTPTLGPRLPAFLDASLTVVGLAALVGSLAFAISTPLWSSELAGIGAGVALMLFVAGSTAHAISQVWDRVFVAFEAARLVLLRSGLAAITRIIVLVVLAGSLGAQGLLVPTVVAATVTSMIAAAGLLRLVLPSYRPMPTMNWRPVGPQLPYALRNHISTLTWSSPAYVYPLLVVTGLGSEVGAQFYVSWMVANLAFVIPTAAATAAFARASTAGGISYLDFFRTVRPVLAFLVLAVAGLIVGGRIVLGFFGEAYTAADALLFPLLLVSALPYAMNTIAIAYHRIDVDTATSLWLPASITGVSLTLSASLMAYGPAGVAAGWLVGQSIGVTVSSWTVWSGRGADRTRSM